MKLSNDITIGEIIRNYPNAVKTLGSFGMGCVGCPSAQAETLEEACQVHGINVEDVMRAIRETVGEAIK
ncbi:MAG: hypothetical protein K0S71_2664 [Clostridia bacterium]|jgi:hybrid cluster-associated redox disulfide protein|nr:hypothetical protein [Clostridia bacterium]